MFVVDDGVVHLAELEGQYCLLVLSWAGFGGAADRSAAVE